MFIDSFMRGDGTWTASVTGNRGIDRRLASVRLRVGHAIRRPAAADEPRRRSSGRSRRTRRRPHRTVPGVWRHTSWSAISRELDRRVRWVRPGRAMTIRPAPDHAQRGERRPAWSPPWPRRRRRRRRSDRSSAGAVAILPKRCSRAPEFRPVSPQHAVEGPLRDAEAVDHVDGCGPRRHLTRSHPWRVPRDRAHRSCARRSRRVRDRAPWRSPRRRERRRAAAPARARRSARRPRTARASAPTSARPASTRSRNSRRRTGRYEPGWCRRSAVEVAAAEALEIDRDVAIAGGLHRGDDRLAFARSPSAARRGRPRCAPSRRSAARAPAADPRRCSAASARSIRPSSPTVTSVPYGIRLARHAAAGLSHVRSPSRRDAARTSSFVKPAMTSGNSAPASSRRLLTGSVIAEVVDVHAEHDDRALGRGDRARRRPSARPCSGSTDRCRSPGRRRAPSRRSPPASSADPTPRRAHRQSASSSPASDGDTAVTACTRSRPSDRVRERGQERRVGTAAERDDDPTETAQLDIEPLQLVSRDRGRRRLPRPAVCRRRTPPDAQATTTLPSTDGRLRRWQVTDRIAWAAPRRPGDLRASRPHRLVERDDRDADEDEQHPERDDEAGHAEGQDGGEQRRHGGTTRSSPISRRGSSCSSCA